MDLIKDMSVCSCAWCVVIGACPVDTYWHTRNKVLDRLMFDRVPSNIYCLFHHFIVIRIATIIINPRITMFYRFSIGFLSGEYEDHSTVSPSFAASQSFVNSGNVPARFYGKRCSLSRWKPFQLWQS